MSKSGPTFDFVAYEQSQTREVPSKLRQRSNKLPGVQENHIIDESLESEGTGKTRKKSTSKTPSSAFEEPSHSLQESATGDIRHLQKSKGCACCVIM